MSEGLLLDTHAALWLSAGTPIRDDAHDAVRGAVGSDAGVHLSPISAWEAAQLLRKRRLTMAIPALTWFSRLLGLPGFHAVELSAAVLVAAVELPGDPPADPADRILIATAREHGLPLVTRDRQILRYGDEGHVRTIPC